MGGWTQSRAMAWLQAHNLIPIKVDAPASGKTFRFRLHDPAQFVRFRIKKLPNETARGVEFVVGFHSNRVKAGEIGFDQIQGGVFSWVKEAFNRFKAAISGPRKNAPPYVRDIIKEYGSLNIVRLVVCRTPIVKAIDTALNWISFGLWNQNKKKLGYDDMFHLYLIATVAQANGSLVDLTFEKNQTVEILKRGMKSSKDEVCIPVPMPGNMPIGLAHFFEKGEKLQGDKFWLYDPFNNNCQVFVKSLLEGNSLLNPQLLNFVYQPAEDILHGFAKTVAQAVVGLASRADILIHGEGFVAELLDELLHGPVTAVGGPVIKALLKRKIMTHLHAAGLFDSPIYGLPL
jgi:hypothetical protein